MRRCSWPFLNGLIISAALPTCQGPLTGRSSILCSAAQYHLTALCSTMQVAALHSTSSSPEGVLLILDHVNQSSVELRNVAAHVHARVVLHQAMLICCRAPHGFCLTRQGTVDTPQQFQAAFRMHGHARQHASGVNGSCGSLQNRRSHQAKGGLTERTTYAQCPAGCTCRSATWQPQLAHRAASQHPQQPPELYTQVSYAAGCAGVQWAACTAAPTMHARHVGAAQQSISRAHTSHILPLCMSDCTGNVSDDD